MGLREGMEEGDMRTGVWTRVGLLGWVLGVVVATGCGQGFEPTTPEKESSDSEVTVASPSSDVTAESSGSEVSAEWNNGPPGANHGKTRWVRRSQGTGTETSRDLAVDEDGNSFIVGAYSGGTADFGAGSLPVAGPGVSRAFVASYTSSGSLRWARSYGDNATFTAVAVDRKGRITVMGEGSGVDLGAGPLSPGVFLAQFSASGALRWSRVLAGPPPFEMAGLFGHLATASNNDVLLAASFRYESADFGGGPHEASGYAVALVRYASDGTFRWERFYESDDRLFFTDVALDCRGDIFVSGGFDVPISFGGPVLEPGVGDSPVLIRYSASGAFRWSRTIPGHTNSLYFNHLAVYGNRVVVAGLFAGSFTFAGRTFDAGISSGTALMAYNRDGEERWAREAGSFVSAVGVDARGGVTLVTSARPGQDLGGGPLPEGPAAWLAIARYDQERGRFLWQRLIPDTGIGTVFARVLPEGDTFVTGSFFEPVDLGTGTLTPVGLSDTFLMRLSR